MKRSITFAVAAFAALTLAGCGTALDSDTARQVSSVPGYSSTVTLANPAEQVGVRNAYLTYPGPEGYKQGAEATVKMYLFNNTPNPIEVVVKATEGTVKMDKPITVPPFGLVEAEVKVSGLKQAVDTAGTLAVTIEFVGLAELKDVPLPVVPPEVALPRSPMKAEGAVEGGH